MVVIVTRLSFVCSILQLGIESMNHINGRVYIVIANKTCYTVQLCRYALDD